MDLLQENSKRKKQSKAQKIVLILLIISIVLSIIIGITLFFIGGFNIQTEYSIAVNGKVVAFNKIGLIQFEDGEKYLPLKILCNELNYQYFNGEYNIAGEDKDKGYINNGKNIIQFYANSSAIYKTEENSIKDYEYYELDNEIIQYNDSLYINIKDLNVALNIIQYFVEGYNQTVIMTPEFWIENNKESLIEMGYEIDESIENIKALAYGYAIVLNNEKYGVISLTKNEVIGNKYNSMTFIEYTDEFIVSNSDNKYGIININGTTKISFQYDSIDVINYSPLLYEVNKVGNYGIMREDGSIINEIKYSGIGYPKDESNNIYYTLIIPILNENIPASIVVQINNKYGLINLFTGEEILPCTLKGIFLIVDKNTSDKYYVVQFEDGSVNTLEKYIENLNKITVNING